MQVCERTNPMFQHLANQSSKINTALTWMSNDINLFFGYGKATYQASSCLLLVIDAVMVNHKMGSLATPKWPLNGPSSDGPSMASLPRLHPPNSRSAQWDQSEGVPSEPATTNQGVWGCWVGPRRRLQDPMGKMRVSDAMIFCYRI